MKVMIRKTIMVLLTLVMVIFLIPVSVYAYVGAMTKDTGGVTAGQQNGYYYLKNDYIGFYICPGGNLTTVPSQKTLNDVKSIGATESHVFYKQTMGLDTWRTDMNTAAGVSSSSVTVDLSDPDNPKLKQILTVSAYNTAVTITYELVQLDEGATTGTTTGKIIEEDSSDNGRTWGVLASASTNYISQDTRLLWMTRHNNFGGVGHKPLGTVRLNRYSTIYASSYPYDPTVTHFSASISAGLSRIETNSASEVFTDSFSYANQFVATEGYMNAMASEGSGDNPTLISGIRGHWNNYSSAVRYSPANNSMLNVEHEFSNGTEAHALWGFRNLFAISENSNIPADPVSIPEEATCVGIINDNGTLAVNAAKNATELKSLYGSKLVAVFRGTFREVPGSFVFTAGAAQLSPSLTATWTEGSGGFSVAVDGTVTAKDVHLSAPAFKIYKPKNSNDTSLRFDFSGGKLAVAIIPDNNSAILHIDIPGATCSVEDITADFNGGLIFSGEMSISTPTFDAANIIMTRLGMGWSNNKFLLNGVEASGAVNMQQLMGMGVGSAEAEINSFPGVERYAFDLELNIFDMFEAAGELELTRIDNGALIPNTLKLRAASEVGVPLVPPVVVAELNGLGGGFENLVDTINGDYFAIPPLRLSISAKGSVLEIIEGWYTILVGAGYYSPTLTDGTLLEMDIIDEYSWYAEMAGDIRNYGGTNYKGLKVSGGMKLDLVIPDSEMPFIKAGGEVNASAFAGLDSYTDSTNAYLILGADGKIYGLVQIPASAWFIKRNLKLASAEVALALGGQTTTAVNNTTFENAIKDAFGNISGYGGVAYMGSLLGFPFRIYYIFQDKDVGIEVGSWMKDMEPFDPSPYSVNKLPLLDEDTGKQVGIMVMNDNLALLGSSWDVRTGESLLFVGTNDVDDNGVSITQTDASEKNYQVNIADTAPDTSYLAFSLKPDESWLGTTGTVESFINSLTVQKSVYSIPLVAAEFDKNDKITNEDEANIIIGNDCMTMKLPSKETWTISSDEAAFDIFCYYACPYASISGMSLSGASLNGTVENMNSATKYILRTYLGTAKGGMDYLLSQSDVPSNGEIDETILLSGSTAPTGSYYVTTLILEEISDDFDGDGTNESAYLTTDDFAFNTKVDYINSEQPDAPTNVTLDSIGSEMMQVNWKASSGSVDGYYIRLYQQDGSDWTETGANYLLKASELTLDPEGYYTFDMAVTVGDQVLHLEAANTYKIGITAFSYLADEDGDGMNDSFPIESSEAQSGEEYLPEAIFPTLMYSPSPTLDENSMKLLHIKGLTNITVTSDVTADIVVTRMDTDIVVQPNWTTDKTVIFGIPDNFTGALNLKITAKDAEGDITVDYLGLRLDDTMPMIIMDSDSFKADLNTGAFTASGVTENHAKVTVTDIITDSFTNGAVLDADTVIANEKGEFTITGGLNPKNMENNLDAADSAMLLLCASDAANNKSSTFAQIVRADSYTITFDANGGTCETAVAETNTSGQLVTLPTPARTNYSFDGWYTEASGGVQITKDAIYTTDTTVFAHWAYTGGSSICGKISFTIKASSEKGGSITSSRSAKVNKGKDVSFTITASDGYVINDVLVDGKSVGPVYFYTFNNVKENHSITANFKKADVLPFKDIDPDDWFYDAVLYAKYNGLMNGTSDDIFSPKLNTSRAMIVTILYRLAKDPVTSGTNFNDVESGNWYSDAISWAVENGIVTGYGNGNFGPNNDVTREQLAVILYNYTKYCGYDNTSAADLLVFNDSSQISNWAEIAMKWAVSVSLINGIDTKQLAPHNTASRAEVAMILKRFCIKYIDNQK